MAAALLALTGAVAALDWWAVATERRSWEQIAKPATLALLVCAAVAGGALGDPSGRFLLAALVLGLIGDVFLLGEGNSAFRAGLAAFLMGHLAYVACFAASGLMRPAWALIGLAMTAAALIVARGVLPSTHRLGGAALSVPVGVYMVVIGAMVTTAWMTGSLTVGAGAAVFVVSDTVLAVHRFVGPLPHGRLITMVTYHLGQIVIVVGLLA